MTFFDCTADLVGQLNGNGRKGMLQIDAPLSKTSGYATASLRKHDPPFRTITTLSQTTDRCEEKARPNVYPLADLGFFRGGDSGNPSERSERALRDMAQGGAQNDIDIT